MRNVAEYLKGMQENEAALAEVYQKLATLSDRVSEIVGKSDMEQADALAAAFTDISAAQKKAAALHIAQGSYNSRIAQDLALMMNRQGYNSFQIVREDNKAAGGDELSKLRDDGIHAVIPAAPSTVEQILGSEHLVAVRRAGQPELKPAKANVSPEFEGLVKVEDE